MEVHEVPGFSTQLLVSSGKGERSEDSRERDSKGFLLRRGMIKPGPSDHLNTISVEVDRRLDSNTKLARMLPVGLYRAHGIRTSEGSNVTH